MPMFGILFACAALAADVPPVVVVNGHTLSVAEWEFLRLTRASGGELSPMLRERLIDQAIERQLIREFLAGRKIKPPADLLDQHLHQLTETVRRRGEDPDKLFPKLGLQPAQLRQELGLPLAWDVYVQQAVSERQLQQYYAEHRPELDGTRVHVRQIFRRIEQAADRAAAEQLLARLKGDIAAQRTTFEAAAREHSQSPSAEQGGDVGWVGAPGRLPEEITLAALQLKTGQLAGPIRTSLGLHLIQVVERQPGQLSLEDARAVILERLSAQLWRDTVEKERASAKILRPK